MDHHDESPPGKGALPGTSPGYRERTIRLKGNKLINSPCPAKLASKEMLCGECSGISCDLPGSGRKTWLFGLHGLQVLVRPLVELALDLLHVDIVDRFLNGRDEGQDGVQPGDLQKLFDTGVVYSCNDKGFVL